MDKKKDKEIIVDKPEDQAVVNREHFEKDMIDIWGHSKVGIEAKKAYMTMLSTKTGLYARVPLICKADNCPYAETCKLLQYDLAPLGEVCPAEAATIEARYAGYNDQFGLDNSSFTDRSLVSELINLDIMADRCKSLMAKEGVPVIDVITGIGENGDTFSHPEVSKYWEAYERTLKRREEILSLMQATRKDNKDEKKQDKNIYEVIEDFEKNSGFVLDKKPKDYVDVEEVDKDNGDM